MAKPKNCDGMGFGMVSSFNKALLGKQWWRILSRPKSFMVRGLKSRYFSNSTTLEANQGHSPSNTWTSLFSVKGIVEKGIIWKVGDGTQIKSWTNRWIPSNVKFKTSAQPQDDDDKSLLVFELTNHK